MIRFELLFGLLTFCLWVFCLIEAVTSDQSEVRNLPKIGWVLIVLFFPLAGSIAWLLAGRPVRSAPRTASYERAAPQFPEYDRPGRAAATDPAADEEFLRKVRERAEQQRRAYRQQQLRRERSESEGNEPPADEPTT